MASRQKYWPHLYQMAYLSIHLGEFLVGTGQKYQAGSIPGGLFLGTRILIPRMFIAIMLYNGRCVLLW